MSNDQKLEPCPFCGGVKFQQNTKAKGYFVKKAAERAGKDTSNHLIRCTKCGAKGPLAHSEAEAITAWNTRAHPAPSVDVGEQPAPYTCKHSCERDRLMDTITAQAAMIERLQHDLEVTGEQYRKLSAALRSEAP